MVGYQKSRRHAASDRRIIERLAVHADWMKYYQDHGYARDDASAKAMIQLKLGTPLPNDLKHDYFMAKIR